jgi:hypothetical protein
MNQFEEIVAVWFRNYIKQLIHCVERIDFFFNFRTVAHIVTNVGYSAKELNIQMPVVIKRGAFEQKKSVGVNLT